MTVIIEVGIGIVFIYLLLSLVASSLTEWFARFRALRSRTLETGIRDLLNDPAGTGLAQSLYNHPLIKGLYHNGHKPSYISSAVFAQAMLDLISPAPTTGPAPAALDELRQAVSGLSDTGLRTAVLALAMALTSAPPAAGAATAPAGAVALRATVERVDNPELKRAVLALIGQPATEAAPLLTSLAQWFDAAMDRVSGWYKRQAQVVTVVIAVVVTLLLNADTLMIADGLSRDPAVRAAAVAAAQQTAGKSGTQPTLDIATFEKEAAQLQLPIGWSTQSGDPRGFPTDWVTALRKILGMILTIVAISLGAPFWFDLLNKLLNLRLTGPPPPEVPPTPARTSTPSSTVPVVTQR